MEMLHNCFVYITQFAIQRTKRTKQAQQRVREKKQSNRSEVVNGLWVTRGRHVAAALVPIAEANGGKGDGEVWGPHKRIQKKPCGDGGYHLTRSRRARRSVLCGNKNSHNKMPTANKRQ